MANKEKRLENRIERLKGKKQTDRRTRRIQKQEDKASGDYTRKEIRARKTGRKVEATKAEIDRIPEGRRKTRLTARHGIQAERLKRLTPETAVGSTQKDVPKPNGNGGGNGGSQGGSQEVTGVQPPVKEKGKKPGSYVKPGGTATGNIGDYAIGSQERRDEYTRRGWAQDETTKVTPKEEVKKPHKGGPILGL